MDYPTGRSLGGAATGRGTNGALSPEELRQKRLQALAGNHTQATSSTGASSIPVAFLPKPPPPTKRTTFLVDEDEDAELQAALALSLQTRENNDGSMALEQTEDVGEQKNEALVTVLPTPPSALQTFWNNAEPFDVMSFHEIMWDAAVTTENDKTRWVAEAIRCSVLNNSSTSTTSVPETSSTMLSLLVQSNQHATWGLTQHFGGPCGVLAAVQAEILKMLIWGTPVLVGSDDAQLNHQASRTIDLDNPDSPKRLLSSILLKPSIVRVAMARAIATILTRAAMRPSATASDGQPNAPSIEPSATSNADATSSALVKIVLPIQRIPLAGAADVQAEKTTAITWTDLEPWSALDATNHVQGNGSRLVTYSITVPSNAPSNMYYKRQKTSDDLPAQGRSNERITTSAYQHHHYLSRVVGDFLLQAPIDGSSIAPIDYFMKEGGVLLLVMSLVSSRGKDLIKSEFDDPSGSKLTAQFGHSSQELINLLLTGQAVSNVFDNNLSPDKEIVCRGVQQQSDIGYLSQLESLRYCEVGSYYKSPTFPIWVVGSTSHFTVLFGDEKALKESKSDLLLEQCRRAFKAVEGGEANGFIASNQLRLVFESLQIDVGAAVQILAAAIEVSGAGIILWDDFWKVASRLMTGTSVETVLQGHKDDNEVQIVPAHVGYEHGASVFDNDNDIPPLIAATRDETDEEIARRMDNEYNSSPIRDDILGLGEAAARTSPMEVETDPNLLSDEELARKLQAEWDAEIGGGGEGLSVSSDRAASGSPSHLSDDGSIGPPRPPTPPHSNRKNDSKSAAKSNTHEHMFEQYGDTICLYHYNGLRGGLLTPFRITRLSAEEAVGASIALNRNARGGGSGDLEDVVRTKWPSCMINWLGQASPYID